MTSREEIHKLVEGIPEARLDYAKRLLAGLTIQQSEPSQKCVTRSSEEIARALTADLPPETWDELPPDLTDSTVRRSDEGAIRGHRLRTLSRGGNEANFRSRSDSGRRPASAKSVLRPGPVLRCRNQAAARFGGRRGGDRRRKAFAATIAAFYCYGRGLRGSGWSRMAAL